VVFASTTNATSIKVCLRLERNDALLLCAVCVKPTNYRKLADDRHSLCLSPKFQQRPYTQKLPKMQLLAYSISHIYLGPG